MCSGGKVGGDNCEPHEGFAVSGAGSNNVRRVL